MSDLHVLLNLFFAFICGGIIGYLREKEGKMAGFRTHILVCVGSTLFMLISYYMKDVSGVADPGRIASGVVTGIGFLGAGIIFQEGGITRGLTTAATIWVTSAIGLAIGAGFYNGAIIATILTLFTLQILRFIESKVIRSKEQP